MLSLHPELKEDDIHSRSMGAGGEDIMLSPSAREIYPLTIECKSQERVNLYSAYQQAQEHMKGEMAIEPVVVLKRNHSKPLVVVDAEYFFRMFK